MKGKWVLCGLVCAVSLSGCGKQELLQEKLDAAEIDTVVVTMAAGTLRMVQTAR